MQQRKLSSLIKDERGSAAILTAISLPALLGLTALVLDLGSLYLAERRLQGIADAAAAAAIGGDIANEGETAVVAMIQQSREANIRISKFDPGIYTQDEAINYHDRFEPGLTTPNAARVQLEQDVPLFFARIFTGNDSSKVVASATAARSDLVAFDLGTRLATLSGGLPNMLLSRLVGVELNLSVGDITQLANTEINVMAFTEALRNGQGVPGATFGDALDQPMAPSDIIKAMAASTNGSAADLLLEIADKVGGQDVVMSELIDLGQFARLTVNDGRSHAAVDAYSLLRSIFEATQGETYSVDLAFTLAGSTKAVVKLAGGYGYVRSPWLTLDTAGDVILRTAQTRIGIDVQTATPVLPLAKVNVPLFVELASAEAQISDINCTRDDPDAGVTVDVRPSVGRIALASFDQAKFSDMSQELALAPATVLETALVRVKGESDVPIGGAQTQQLHFTPHEIEADVRKEAGTIDIVAVTLDALVNDVNYQVQALGLNLGLGLSDNSLTSSLTDTLTGLAPGIDSILNQVLEVAGLKLGVAQVGVIDLQCGRPAIVG